MMIKASRFAIAIAAVASLAIATTKVSSAAPIAAGANTVKAPAATEVRQRCKILTNQALASKPSPSNRHTQRPSMALRFACL